MIMTIEDDVCASYVDSKLGFPDHVQLLNSNNWCDFRLTFSGILLNKIIKRKIR